MLEDNSRQRVEPTAIVLIAMVLMAVGVVMIASASSTLDRPLFGSHMWRFSLGRQIVFAVVGMAVMTIGVRAVVSVLSTAKSRERAAWMLFAFVVLTLICTFIPGLSDAHRGSQRWLRLGPAAFSLGLQPSELAKVGLVAVLAVILGRSDSQPRSFKRGFLPAALAVGLCAALVGTADFGTAVLLAAVGGLMLFVGGCRLHHLLAIVALGGAGLVGLLFSAEYRLERLKAYANLWEEARGAAYQPLQSLTTIASGGWYGTGLGAGTQKYGYLPESHTDFIFALICEEMGVLGAGFVIALFAVMIWLGLKTMLAARTRFERLLAFGVTTTIGLQAVMNIAVVTVLAPTTGISLPLVSAGGSGLLTFCLACCLLAAIAMRSKEDAPDFGGASVAEANLPAQTSSRENFAW